MLGYATVFALVVSSVSAATGTTARAAATNNNQGFTTKFATPTNDPYYAGTATRYVTATATKIKSKSTCLKNCNGKRGWSKNGIILFVFLGIFGAITLLVLWLKLRDRKRNRELQAAGGTAYNSSASPDPEKVMPTEDPAEFTAHAIADQHPHQGYGPQYVSPTLPYGSVMPTPQHEQTPPGFPQPVIILPASAPPVYRPSMDNVRVIENPTSSMPYANVGPTPTAPGLMIVNADEVQRR